jgi:dihydrofolate synthase/folylpolyglutamate synthase
MSAGTPPFARMTYPQALEYIASLAPRGWRLGLDRMQELLRRAELSEFVGPGGRPAYIHVTGTNGKGSVTAYVQSLLVEQGYRAGAFFSPYVYDPRERVQFGREMISEEDLAELTRQLIDPAESLSETEFGGATEFEFKTALGFKYWVTKQCEWVALEVGLGGRLDATNVVTPRASVIVSIALDHTNILGTTLSEIAYEKAGIIKSGVPAIVGAVPQEARKVIERIAAERDAPLWRFGHEIALVETAVGYRVQTPNGEYDDLRPGLHGVKQAHNMALAIAAMDAAGAFQIRDRIGDGVAAATLPGRMERRSIKGRDVLLDGAHNPDAAQVLRENLDIHFPGRKVVLVAGMVAGHDPLHFFEPLKGRVRAALAVPIDFHRALDTEEVAAAMLGLTQNVQQFRTLESGIKAAYEMAGEDDLILITGSFYLVGQAGPALSRF